jgi:signal transduction histidine kinase
MMLFARPPQLEPGEVTLSDVVADVFRELADDAARQGTRLVFESNDEGSPPLRITADAGQLRVALKAVVQNSLEAIGGGGLVAVTFERSKPNGHALRGEQCRIVVSDTGPGIPPEVRRHLFDPFYSGREAGRGLGFGLSKAWRIVTAHGGLIDVASEPGRGATIALCLPLHQTNLPD